MRRSRTVDVSRLVGCMSRRVAFGHVAVASLVSLSGVWAFSRPYAASTSCECRVNEAEGNIDEGGWAGMGVRTKKISKAVWQLLQCFGLFGHHHVNHGDG
ncbi:uncharacterized protein LACBIDRAFT_308660 [Laccaria bicolor S238N-H82]|uniref:Predicted protein n=1 Tax=Laccaria bicolor (strain S238N-H82 / ATCC MYA-4686) TaxID=486041 RepID=B0CWW6_LACBS|nr:uncharacterized protein LACBIDRAFT_308660 [Laccaria bicolor S238N-H82]EDR13577.1 predicted protein [Laccaria bicolor S238N-H82]|eukprot:XP_001876075.1 predicted protein [Laccaria bicolor S238N-H82]